MDESAAIVQRLFELAARRVGSAYALGQYLGLSYRQVQPYLAGEAIPPEPVLLRTVELVIDDLKLIRGSFSERAWQALALPQAACG
jgi:hypothetical protein